MADEDFAPPPEPAVERPAISRWTKWLAGLGLFAIAVGIAGTVIRLPYDTFSPGSALNLKPLVTVNGAKTYSDSGQVMLLFVRERDHVNVWSWLQAKLDSKNIEMVDQVAVSGGQPEEDLNAEAVSDMTQSQVSAKAAALTALGYRLRPAPGLLVTAVLGSKPAGKVLAAGDQIIAADGHVLTQSTDLAKFVRAHRPGTAVKLRIVRGGHTQTVSVGVVSSGKPKADHSDRVIGVLVLPTFRFPVRIAVDTSNITGPSAGLAMTLAIIDKLTPGDLTGGKRVAVTGTITPDGAVGQIGAIEQKGISAKAAHAQIFIVPACGKDAACAADLAKLKRRVGKNIAVDPVSTLAQALRVLRDAGGAPVHPIIRPTS